MREKDIRELERIVRKLERWQNRAELDRGTLDDTNKAKRLLIEVVEKEQAKNN